MKKLLVIFFIISICSFSNSFYNFQKTVDKEYIYKIDKNVIVFNSNIDWTEQKIYVTASQEKKITNGFQLKRAYLTLKTLAIKRAGEILDDINIDCKVKVIDYKKMEPNFTKKLEIFLSNVDTLEQTYDRNTNIVNYSISLPITGKDKMIEVFIEDYLDKNLVFDYFKNFFDNFGTKLYAEDLYTGMIIDARNIDLDTAIFPKVIAEDNTDVYSPSDADKDIITEQGSAQYIVVGNKVDKKYLIEQSLIQNEEALTRTGTKPAIIEAYKSAGPLKTDAVISQKDAQAVQQMQALKEAKVSIIVDARVGGIIGRKIGDYEIIIVKGY